jgi:sedoheptulose-bisphosphatase
MATEGTIGAAPAAMGITLAAELRRAALHPRLSSVVDALAGACAEISGVLRGGAESGGGTEAVGTQNAFGNTQLEVDLRADDVILEHLAACGSVATTSSEERPVERAMNHDSRGNVYSVAFDPVDGSSIVDCNWAVGTIVSVTASLGAGGACGARGRGV